MEYSQCNATALVKEFIVLLRKYKKSPSDTDLEKLREINNRYKKMNGSGCLFSVNDVSYLR